MPGTQLHTIAAAGVRRSWVHSRCWPRMQASLSRWDTRRTAGLPHTRHTTPSQGSSGSSPDAPVATALCTHQAPQDLCRWRCDTDQWRRSNRRTSSQCRRRTTAASNNLARARLTDKHSAIQSKRQHTKGLSGGACVQTHATGLVGAVLRACCGRLTVCCECDEREAQARRESAHWRLEM